MTPAVLKAFVGANVNALSVIVVLAVFLAIKLSTMCT
jgi:hypothetical protein